MKKNLFSGKQLFLFDKLESQDGIYNIQQVEYYEHSVSTIPPNVYSLQKRENIAHIAWISSSNTIKHIKIDLNNLSAAPEEKTYTIQGASFSSRYIGFASWSSIKDKNIRYNILPITSDNYMYVPHSEGMTYYKINLNDLNDYAILETEYISKPTITYNDWYAISCSFGGLMLNNDMYIGPCFTIRDDKVYKGQVISNGVRGTTDYHYPYIGGYEIGNGVWINKHTNNYDNRPNTYCLLIPSGEITTINNLPQPITKTDDQSMRLIYTITRE